MKFKILFISLTLLLQIKTGNCQILNGTYSHADTNVSRYDIFNYTFHNDKFNVSINSCGWISFGSGNYELKNDSIFLYFEKNDTCPKVNIKAIDTVSENRILKIWVYYYSISYNSIKVKNLKLLDSNGKIIKEIYYDYYFPNIIELSKKENVTAIQMQKSEHDFPVLYKILPNKSQEIEFTFPVTHCMTKGEVWKYKISDITEEGFTIVQEIQGKLYYSPFKRYSK